MSRLTDERQNKEGGMTDLVDYQQDGAGIKVRLDAAHDTVWLRQEQMGELFGRERSVITKHLRNIFAEGELEEESNVQNLHIAGSDKPVRFYNLQDTVWPSQAQMVELFGCVQTVVSRHIRNALAEGMVTEKNNMQKMHIANFGLGMMPQFELLQKLHQFKREQQASQVSSLISLAQGGVAS